MVSSLIDKEACKMNIGGSAVGDGHDIYACGPCMHVFTITSSLERRQSHIHLVWSDMHDGPLLDHHSKEHYPMRLSAPRSLQATTVLSSTHQSPVCVVSGGAVNYSIGTPIMDDHDDPCMHALTKWTSL